MTTPLALLPAVDVQDGQAVRLVQGEYGTATNYGDPFEAAIGWQQLGAKWLHLVDLDAAFGHGNNREIIHRITRELGIQIELSGGIRDDESLDEALEMGATRVNLGTAALEHPDWTAKVIHKYGDRIAVGLDVRGEKLATRGWVEESGNIWDVLSQLEEAGCARYVVTDITKDGTLTGPNTGLLLEIAAQTGKPVIASGGISTLDDIAQLTTMVDDGIEGAIVGKALYAGQFTLPQALQVASGAAAKDV